MTPAQAPTQSGRHRHAPLVGHSTGARSIRTPLLRPPSVRWSVS